MWASESDSPPSLLPVPATLAEFNRQTRIQTQAGLEPFEPWPWQAKQEAEDWSGGVPGVGEFLPLTRIIQHKSREIGSSEWYMRRFLWMQRLFGAGDIIVVPDVEEHGWNLIEQAFTVIRYAPSGWFPPIVAKSVKHIEFSDGTSVEALPGTSTAPKSERGRYILATEMSVWKDADTQWGSLRGSMAALGGINKAFIVVESTAFGVGNLFHRMWIDGENGFKKRFDGRNENPNHTPEWFAQVQLDLRATPAFISQEFPLNSAEGFLESGRVAFPIWFQDTPQGLVTYDSKTKAIVTLDAHGAADMAAAFGVPSKPNDWREPIPPIAWPPALQAIWEHPHFSAGHDILEVWAVPEPRGRYVIGADVAEGLAHGDYDDACVLDWETGEDVAHLRGRWDPVLYAEFLYSLAQAFPGVLAVERNGHGHTTLAFLKQWGMDFPELYHSVDPDPARGSTPWEAQGQPGWTTSDVSRPIMLDGLITALRLDLQRPRAHEFWVERQTFQWSDRGKAEAAKGYYDDHIMARAIAYQVRGGPMPAPAWERLAVVGGARRY